MKKIAILLSFFFIVPNLFSQGIAINTSGLDPHVSAMLDVSSTTKGVLIPRMTKAQRDAITPLTGATGLMIFQTDQTAGFYYYNGGAWQSIGADVLAINDLMDGISDGSSVFLGNGAGINDDGSNANVGVGISSLTANTSGLFNTAVGALSLNANTSGIGNTSIGHQSMLRNTTGNNNTTVGINSLRENLTGYSNSALGEQALNKNSGGHHNSGMGFQALYANINGNYNTAMGDNALFQNTGSNNSAFGTYALQNNSSGQGNIGIGYGANRNNQTGSYNTILGYEAGNGPSSHNKSYNVFLGYQAGYNETGSNKLYIENSNSSFPLIGGDFDIDELYLNGKVGIGTMNPLTKLQVNGNITFSPAGLTFDESRFIGQSIASQSSFDANNGFGGLEVENIDKDGTDDSAQQLHFWTHNQGTDSERRMTIDTQGVVGIGTTEPSGNLEVVSDQGVSTIIATTYRDVTAYNAGQFIGRAARGFKDSPSAVQMGDVLASFNGRGYGNTGFSNRPRGRLSFTAAENWTDDHQGTYLWLTTTPVGTATNEERFRISSQGNVGIGTPGSGPEHKLHIVQDSSGAQGLVVTQNADHNAATFEIENTGSDANTLNVYNRGSGYGMDLVIHDTGTGPGGRFTIDNPANNQPAIYGEHNGVGRVAEFISNNSGNSFAPLNVLTKGIGSAGIISIDNNTNNSSALSVSTNGTGSAGNFSSNNSTNNYATIFSIHNGIGSAGRFQINNAGSSATVLHTQTSGTGDALRAINFGDGIAGFFSTVLGTNNNPAIHAYAGGGGSAGEFTIDNTANTDPVVLIEGNGSGPSISANGTIDMSGFRMATSAIEGNVLTSDATGIGSWQVPSFDFANGGEIGGANRTLGNTDNFALGFKTNNIERLHIANDGNIGIGTTSAGDLLEVKGGSDGQYFGISINQKTDHFGYPSLFFKDNSDNLLASIFPHQTRTHLYFRLNSGDFIFDRPGGASPQMTIKASGNVGIGLTTPDEKLHVDGGVRINGALEDKDGDAGTAGQILSSTVTGTDWTDKTTIVDFADGGESGGADRSLGNTDNYALSLKTNNIARQKILNDGGIRFDGNIGIFTDPKAPGINKAISLHDSEVFSNPHLKISGDNSGYIELISRRSDITNGKSWHIGSGSGSALNLDRFYIYNADDGNVLTIRDGGNIGISADTPTASLDIDGSTGYNQLRLRTTYTPTSSTDTNGNVGDIAWDDDYIYIKTSTGWKRTALASW